jgi:hypothetical protein
MICPGTRNECDNPGCRHGGCQGRMPELPLFRAASTTPTAAAATPIQPKHKTASFQPACGQDAGNPFTAPERRPLAA